MNTKNCYRPGPSRPIVTYSGERPDCSRERIGKIHFDDHPEFQPNVTPRQMFLFGIFGGSYFRDITSGVTGKKYVRAYEEFSWLSDMPVEWHSAARCQKGVNRYGVFSGTSKEFWESKGWITEYDPYGWVQWYCRFYEGRRCPDDERQIKRWQNFAGRHGRFRLALMKRITAAREERKAALAAGKHVERKIVAPVIRQALLQWGVAT